MMRKSVGFPVLVLMLMSGCLNIEEEPILTIKPAAVLSAHIKNKRLYATALINVNPQVLTVGNIPTIYEFEGDLAIYNTVEGTRINVIAFSGGGLSQVYTVSADTASHSRFVVVAAGSINAYADIGNDGDETANKLISKGDFYAEEQYVIADLDLENREN